MTTALASGTLRVLLMWAALAIAGFFVLRLLFNLLVDLFDTP